MLSTLGHGGGVQSMQSSGGVHSAHAGGAHGGMQVTTRDSVYARLGCDVACVPQMGVFFFIFCVQVVGVMHVGGQHGQ